MPNTFEHFMLKEIHEQPQTIINTLADKVQNGKIVFKELPDKLATLERIIILGCGTSWHAGILGKLYIEKYAKLPVEVDYASEFTHRELPLNENVLVICISQSGETADTKIAQQAARAKGASIAAICNVIGASIATEADYAIYTHAGEEISIASTKAFTCQALTLLLFALWLGERRKAVDNVTIASLLAELAIVPDKLNTILGQQEHIKAAAEHYKNTQQFLYIGRNFTCPIALEGALKLKETSYIHAEGYPAGELKHGPIALLDANFPLLAFAPHIKVQDKIFGSIQEAAARAEVVAVFSECNRQNHPTCTHALFIPDCENDEMTPFLTVTVAQLFAYYIAKGLGKNVDKPRNLSKSVTAE